MVMSIAYCWALKHYFLIYTDEKLHHVFAHDTCIYSIYAQFVISCRIRNCKFVILERPITTHVDRISNSNKLYICMCIIPNHIQRNVCNEYVLCIILKEVFLVMFYRCKEWVKSYSFMPKDVPKYFNFFTREGGHF